MENSKKNINELLHYLRILVVEDDLDCVSILENMFQKSTDNASHTVISAQTLNAAQKLLKETTFDLVLLDLNLPDSHGMETLTTLYEMCPDQMFVVITGCDDEELRQKIIQKGARDYFVKGKHDESTLYQLIQSGLIQNKLEQNLEITQKELETRLEDLSEVAEGMNSLQKEIGEKELEIEQAKQKARVQAFTDPVTYLYNRKGLQQVVVQELSNLKRINYNACVFLINIDNFHVINDKFGRSVGDIVLREVSKRIKRALRATDRIARLGSDEFMVLLPNIRIGEGVKVAEKLRLFVAHDPIIISSGEQIALTMSIAMTELTEHIATVDELLIELTPAIKRSRKLGHNRVSLAIQEYENPEDTEDIIYGIIAQLKKGELFYPVKHAIVRLADEKIIGYELLSRFSGSVFQAPADFFRICIENNILTKVDRQCFQMCLNKAREVAKEHRKHINLYPSTIIDIPMEQLLHEFSQFNEKKNFCIEISEQQIIGDPAYLLEPVQAFKDAGIIIAIDDVGFGQSCLESLVILEPDVMKIDKCRIMGLANSSVLKRQVARFVSIADALNIEVIAEGIETKADCDALKTLGVQYGQGYYWGTPK